MNQRARPAAPAAVRIETPSQPVKAGGSEVEQLQWLRKEHAERADEQIRLLQSINGHARLCAVASGISIVIFVLGFLLFLAALSKGG